MMVIFAKEERAGAVEKARALKGITRGARRRRDAILAFGRFEAWELVDWRLVNWFRCVV